MNVAAADLATTQRGLRRWAWGRRAFARILELSALLTCEARRAGGRPDVQDLKERAEVHLGEAGRAIRGAPSRWPLRANEVDGALANMNAAHTLIVQIAPLEDFKGMLPDLAALVEENLRPGDRRRNEVEKIVADGRQNEITYPQRRAVVDAVRAAYRAEEREVVQVRSFARIVYSWALGLFAIALGVATLGWFYADAVPLCFDPRPWVICPTEQVRTSANLNSSYNLATTPLDFAIVEAAGFVAAAVTAAGTLRQIRGSATAYNVPLALAVLKLPTGALTAVLGLLLMRGDFVPGLTALDSSSQIIAWAIIFGAAQQLFTRFVDARGTAVMQSVKGPGEETGSVVPAGSTPVSRAQQ